MSGEAIYRNFTEASGGGDLSAAAEMVRQLQGSYEEGAGSVRALAVQMESAWRGDAAGVAQRGAVPLAAEQELSAPQLFTAQDLFSRQVGSFDSAKSSVVPLPAAPQRPGGWEVVTSPTVLPTYEQKLAEHNAASQHNVDVMAGYEGASTYNGTNLPASYGSIAPDSSGVGIQQPETRPDPGPGVDWRNTREPDPRPDAGGGPGPGGQPGPEVGGPAPAPGPVSGPNGAPPQTTPGGFTPPPGGPGGGGAPVISGPGSGGPAISGPGIGGGILGFGPGVGAVPGPGSGFDTGGRVPGGGPGTGGRGGPGGGPTGGPLGGRGLGEAEHGPGGRGVVAAGAPAAEAAARGGPGRGGGVGGVPVGAAAGRDAGGEDREYPRPSFLIEDDPEGLFGADELTAPPVIGLDDD